MWRSPRLRWRPANEVEAEAVAVTGDVEQTFERGDEIVIVILLIVAANQVDDVDDINSDPSDGVCNEDRFLQDPDC